MKNYKNPNLFLGNMKPKFEQYVNYFGFSASEFKGVTSLENLNFREVESFFDFEESDVLNEKIDEENISDCSNFSNFINHFGAFPNYMCCDSTSANSDIMKCYIFGFGHKCTP